MTGEGSGEHEAGPAMRDAGGAPAGGAPAGAAPAGGDLAAQAAEVTAFRAELGLGGLIDIHTHFMPANVMRKVWAYFDNVAPGLGHAWPIAYRQPEDERIGLLRAFGVRRFSALNYPHKPGMAAWLNDWSRDFAARTPDALHSGTFFPEPGVADYVATALADGARLFKAHLQVGDYDPRADLLDPVWDLLAEARTPVVVHCGSGPFPGRYTGPGPIGEVIARHPRLTVIIAHFGTPEYAEFLDFAEHQPGVYLDTTMVFTDYLESRAPFPAGQLPRLAGLRGKILLGSDFPNIPYPYPHQLQALARLGIGAAWLRAVCHDNAAALLGL
jgi:hypothetical protein